MQQEHQKEICPYCKADLSNKEWNSEFHFEHHYKIHDCKCGKKIIIKVNFHGSGHDSWDNNPWQKEIKQNKYNYKTKVTTLEHKIKK
ncbi:MAG: hypothetical protein KAU20_02670 [Nanoarchaeota archaeon]|nr:hypothetical protein [Nanoarchaeota archaeon]